MCKDLYCQKRLHFLTNSVLRITGYEKKNPTLIVNHHIRMISEGSCDMENSQLYQINFIFKYIQIENCYFKL